MNVAILLDVLNYFIISQDDFEVTESYAKLIQSLKQVTQSPGEEATKNLDVARRDLYSKNDVLEPQNWSYPKVKLFNLVNDKGIIGYQANNRIQGSFQDNQANPAGVIQCLKEILAEYQAIQENVESINSVLSPLMDAFEEEPFQEDEAVVYLFFENNTSLVTIRDLEKASKEWNVIIRSFARLAKDSTATPKVYSIEKGSVIMGLLAGIGTVAALARGVTEILDVYKKVLEIRKLQLETKKLRIGTEVEKAFQEKIKKTIEGAASNTAEKLVTEFEWSGKEDDINEVKNSVSISLRKVFKFVEDGGKVDYQEKIDNRKSKSIRTKLNKSYDNIKEIQRNMQTIRELPDIN